MYNFCGLVGLAFQPMDIAGTVDLRRDVKYSMVHVAAVFDLYHEIKHCHRRQ